MEQSEAEMKFWTELTMKLGVPSAIALLLTYAMITSSQDEHRSIDVELKSLRQTVVGVVDVVGQSHMVQDRTLYVLRRICVNEARTPADRDACLRDN